MYSNLRYRFLYMKKTGILLLLLFIGLFLPSCRPQEGQSAQSVLVHINFPKDIAPGPVLFRYLDNGETFRLNPSSSDGTFMLKGEGGALRSLAAVYPADAAVSFADGRLYFEIPPEQTGTLSPLLYATAEVSPGYEATDMTLTPLYRVLQADLGRTPFSLRTIDLVPSDGSLLSGRAWVDLSTGKRGASQSKITVTPEEPLDCRPPGTTLSVMVPDPSVPISAVLTFTDGTKFPIQDLAVYSKLINTPYTLGTSLAINSSQNETNISRIPAAGIRWVEVTCNSFWRNIPEAEWNWRARNIQQLLKDYGLKVWSCHLPYSGTMDISVLDDAKRAENLAVFKRIIRLCGELYQPQRLVLHPSSEPISDAERPRRLENAKASIKELAPVAKEIGAVLCVENLPRTCLGRVTEEMKELIAETPDVMVTFDTNHLLIESHEKYFDELGDRIGNIHVSDYDRIDERHALPGNGVIDWPYIHWRLRLSGYNGIFMYEVKASAGKPADLIMRYNNVIFGE